MEGVLYQAKKKDTRARKKGLTKEGRAKKKRKIFPRKRMRSANRVIKYKPSCLTGTFFKSIGEKATRNGDQLKSMTPVRSTAVDIIIITQGTTGSKGAAGDRWRVGTRGLGGNGRRTGRISTGSRREDSSVEEGVYP